MFFKIKSYLIFLYKSKNQHGVHSPFVFDLITKCFYKKTEANKLKIINLFRNDLLQRRDFINVSDFGKGSKIFKSNRRQISKIAKVAGISNKRSKLLIRLVSYLTPINALEIGTSLGLGTASIALGNKNTLVTSLEGCPNTANIAIESLKKYHFKNTQIIIGDFKETLLKEIKNNSFDFVFFDGNHQKKPTLKYFELCLKNIQNDSLFIFDDINWSKEMQEAWEIIKSNPKVTVTIDTYFWGFVFFRKEQEKEHFVIRI